MNKKQTIGLMIAAVIFVVVGIIGVMTNVFASLLTSKQEKTATGLNSFFEELYGTSSERILSDMPYEKDFIAVVPIRGTIQGNDAGTGMYATTGYNHDFLMDYVDQLMETKNNKGIILRLDTPGGTVYHADELYLKLMEYKNETGNPIWAYMESTCCSGGVYIASAADEEYANRISTTGSIGVIVSTYDMSGLYEKLGIKEVNVVSGENKDMGTAAKPMTDEQMAVYQSFVDEYYEQFVKIVAEGRKMSVAEVKQLADGRIYTAKQAEKNGLIDGIKTSDEFDSYVKEQSDVETFYEPKSNAGYLSGIFGSMSAVKEKSEAEVLVDLMDRLGSGVPMYYAEPIGK